MLDIVKLSESLVIFSDEETGYTASFSNSAAERKLVQKLLSDNDLSHLWEAVILPEWRDSPITPSIQPIVSTLSEMRINKQADIKQWCNQHIVNGISIDLGLVDGAGDPLGPLHYSLTERHQTDMRDLALMIANGATQVTWRDDSRVSHMIYTAEQFMTLYQAMSTYILQCRFRSDGLEELLFSYTDDQVDLITSLNWDTELPAEIQVKSDELLATMLAANSTGVVQ